jgi:hypothetical protein
MSDASNTAAILSQEHFSGKTAVASPPVNTFGHGLLRNLAAPMAARSPEAYAAGCLQAAAIMDVVEGLTANSASEGAQLARSGASWALRERHRRYWAARKNQPPGGSTPRSGELLPLGTFGANSLTIPCGMALGPDGNLWVASLGAERLSVFSPEGELVRHVPLPGSQPWGVFAAEDETFWVCDYAQPRLTRIGRDNTPTQHLDVPQRGPVQDLRPILGAAHGSALYLILSDKAGRNRRLARLDTGADTNLELLPCPVSMPSAVRVQGDTLYVSGQNPPVLVSRPLQCGAWTCRNAGLVPEYLTQFTFAGERVWLAANGLLARLSPAGIVELAVDAGTLSGYPDSNFCDLCVVDGKDGQRLYATDNIHNLVHVFRLSQ